MTKTEYIATHAQKATEQVSRPEFRALMAVGRRECPQLGKNIADPTGLVRNEGFIQGWYAALAFMESAHEPPKAPAPPNPDRQQYPDPANPKQLNPKQLNPKP